MPALHWLTKETDLKTSANTPCRIDERRIKNDISFENLAAHIFFSETKAPMKRPKNKSKKSAFLGIYNDTAYALLYNGILVVEYKGAHIADSQDTKEKTLIGELWEKHMKGKGLFLLAVKNKDGKTVAEQIQAKIHAR